ncbi:MAG: McrB family protein [Bacteroidales bacterium]
MIQKQVVINNDVYDCDIDVTVDEWKKILEDKNIKANNYIDMLIKFYNEPEHKSTCKAIGEKYNISPQSPNSIITNFAKATQKILNRFEVISTEGKPTYWIIPMTGKYIENNNFEWTMRPELVKALEEQSHLYVENRNDVITNINTILSGVKSDNEEEVKYAIELLRRGNNFVIELIGNEYFFGPSRFLGYKNNTFNSHVREKGYGSYTDIILEKIYNRIDKENKSYRFYKDILEKINNKYEIGCTFKSLNKIYIPKEEIKINYLNTNNMKDIDTIINLLNSKKQIILQGAPGTGKTFITAEIAVALCDGVDNIPPTREKIMERYNELVNEERIDFTTFHQSMDYEKFVEGIKPVKDSDPMRFDVQDGILKQICSKANAGISINNNDLINIDSAIEWLKDKVKTNSIDINTKRGASFNLSFKDGNNRFTTIPENAQGKQKDNYGVSFESIKIYYNEGRENLHNFSYVRGIVNYLKNNYLSKPYVLIIDEINRGNISKILGELITLLEADKRIGEENELQATLPYSNKKLSVPSNLYIIGTMNTADRSLGYIDYAVRRRFAFYTLQADRSVIENYYQNNEALKSEAINLFDEVQKFISKNIASEFNVEDLMIGHSYFLAKDEEELNMKLEYEIKPLLREYAFDGILDKLKKVDGKYKVVSQKVCKDRVI